MKYKVSIVKATAQDVAQSAQSESVRVLAATANRLNARYVATALIAAGYGFNSLLPYMPDINKQVIIFWPGYAFFAPRVTAFVTFAGFVWLALQRRQDAGGRAVAVVDKTPEELKALAAQTASASAPVATNAPPLPPGAAQDAPGAGGGALSQEQ